MTTTLPSTVDAVLDRAAVLIDTHGLNRYYFGQREDVSGDYLPDCPLCILGAIQDAVTGQPDAYHKTADQHSLIEEAVTWLCRHLTGTDDDVWNVVAAWSDADGRTVDEVYMVLRAAAQAWRDGAR